MKNGRKHIICALVMMGATIIASPITSSFSIMASAVEAENTGIEPRDYIIDWRFKVIGDHLYKRLYNYTTQQWIGDWILVE